MFMNLTQIGHSRANPLFLNPSGIMGEAKSTQPGAMESTTEETVHLPCNHSTISGNEYIYWYRQIPHQGPEYVIHGLKGTETKGTSSLIIATDRKSSTLVLPHVSLRDSAVYYCIVRDPQCHTWGCTCVISAWQGKQHQHLKSHCTRKSTNPMAGEEKEKEKKEKEVKRRLRKSRRKELKGAKKMRKKSLL